MKSMWPTAHGVRWLCGILALSLLVGCNSWADRVPARGVQAIGEEKGFEDLPKLIRHEESGIEFLLVEPGHFTMGSTGGTFFEPDEKPPVGVRITRPFYLARTEVTRGQWARYVEAGGTAGKAMDEPSWASQTGATDLHPVVSVSHGEAKAFCDRFGMELPGEALWEYACRAGTRGHFVHGDDIFRLQEQGWYGDFDANADRGAHPVGQLAANPWGFVDMHGNVREWCADAYDPKAYGKLGAEIVDPEPVSEGSARVVRGGSWKDKAKELRSSNRHALSPSYRDERTGFRPMLRVEQKD